MRWTPTHIPDILEALGQHLLLVGLSVGIAFAIALVLGIWSARRPAVYAAVLAVTGAIFVIPSLALFALMIPFMGLGTKPAVAGLVAYCLLILVRNVATGMRAVPADVLDAALGMGYGRWGLLWRIELPLALPHIVAGIRLATVTVIGIATVAAYINAGGLGAIIFAGIDQRYPEKIIVGGLLTSLLAIGADFVLTRVERRLRADRSA
ncbi:ABC transporter permease [Arenibaculum pallidiluteum]|uniref:ABC transporter permease n=1 Tax=Arenibaculum pallidiluteum TaxID=2812559 RepID=UPI001A961AE3|nr:ABC transporter permease [Arenibaculum pallidiluteum]